VHSHLLHHRIVLFQFNALGSILPIFRGDVAAHASQATALVFGAFQNYLDSVLIPCHDLVYLKSYDALAKKPSALASFKTAEIPFLVMVLIALVVSFKVIHFPSSGMKNLFF